MLKKRRSILCGLGCTVLLCVLILLTAVVRAGAEISLAADQLQNELQPEGRSASYVKALPTITVIGTRLSPQSASCVRETAKNVPDTPLYRLALRYADVPQQLCGDYAADAEMPQLKVHGAEWSIQPPDGWQAQLTVKDADGTVLYDGALAEEYTDRFSKDTVHSCRMELTRQDADGQTGCVYAWTVAPQVEVTVTLSDEQPLQGDVVAVLVENNIFQLPMTVETELGLCDFVPLGEGSYGAFVPVAYNAATGEHGISVTIREKETELTADVQQRDFAVQYMTIDQGIADSTMNSAAASAEYRSAIYPLYELTDREKLWDGKFVEPVDDYYISTEYGLWRYTNGVYSERHSGVDMACVLGTPVAAPQNGRVLFAGFLQLTGNTVVLAHGGGVKSMFYHMDSLNVAEGDLLRTGDKIGEVGTTGYSTGPHLHYEVKIGSRSIDPFQLFDGTSGLFAGQNVS